MGDLAPIRPVNKAALEKEVAESTIGQAAMEALQYRRTEQAQSIVLGEAMRETLEAAATPEHLAKLTGAALAKTMYAVLAGDVSFKNGDDAARFIRAAGEWFLLLGGEPTQISTNLTPEQRQQQFETLRAKALNAQAS